MSKLKKRKRKPKLPEELYKILTSMGISEEEINKARDVAQEDIIKDAESSRERDKENS